MRYTQAQVREAVGLTTETFRHWRKAISDLEQRTGHAPLFTPGDLVALALLRVVVEDFGLPINRMAIIAPRLFSICNTEGWAALEQQRLLLTADKIDLLASGTHPDEQYQQPVLIVPIAPTLTRLRDHLVTGIVEPKQATLSFPPVAIRGRRSA